MATAVCWATSGSASSLGESVSTGGEFPSDGFCDMSFKGAREPCARRILSDLLPPK